MGWPKSISSRLCPGTLSGAARGRASAASWRGRRSRNGAFNRVEADLVGGAVGAAALDAAADQRCGIEHGSRGRLLRRRNGEGFNGSTVG